MVQKSQTTTWDVQFLVNNGINYRSLNWFSRRISTINHLSWRKANFFPSDSTTAFLTRTFFLGPFYFGKPTETLQKNAADQGNDLLEVLLHSQQKHVAKQCCMKF